jgi:hypothetical protein
MRDLTEVAADGRGLPIFWDSVKPLLGGDGQMCGGWINKYEIKQLIYDAINI